jgi:EAL domain-containing protein (putative c-di-GMP-specific phosphodiesterase class I)
MWCAALRKSLDQWVCRLHYESPHGSAVSPRSRYEKGGRRGPLGARKAGEQHAVADVLAERAFHLVYQPIVHLDSGTVAGVEALCRFVDGTPPERRFQEAERLGLAADLDLAIIRLALDELPNLPPGYVSINLSPSTLLDARLGDVLLAADVPAGRIVIEVTEHARITDYDRAQELVGALRASGMRLAVDDAGAGYSTFRHVLRLRPDIIKMDRSITENIDSDTARRALATALVIFAGELGATVIAEGAETQAEILALRRVGIHRAQGYALARPAPLPLGPIDYEPVSISELLDLPLEVPDLPAPTGSDADAAVWAHKMLASVGGIAGVLDMLNERLVVIGEERYQPLVGTAQRQAHQVEGSLRALVRGLPPDLVHGVDALVATPAATDSAGSKDDQRRLAGRLEEDDDDRADDPATARARRRLRAVADALSAAQADLEDTVSLCRAAGITWDEIADVLGMTRQGVSKRFGKGRLT